MLIICRRLGGGIVVVRETGTAGRGRTLSPASHARNVSGFVCGQSLSLCLSGQSGYLSRSLGPLFFFCAFAFVLWQLQIVAPNSNLDLEMMDVLFQRGYSKLEVSSTVHHREPSISECMQNIVPV